MEFITHASRWLRLSWAIVLLLGLIIVGYTAGHAWKDLPLLHHNVYDQYSRQAELWWNGQYFFTQDISYLELATYGNNWYVSFPPLPSVLAWVLYPWFGVNTPNTLLSHFALLGAALALYRLLRTRVSPTHATLWTALAVAGSNALQLGFSGSVWFHAQILAFFFSSIAVWQLNRRTWAGLAWGGVALALAVGCRPLHAVYGLVFGTILLSQTPHLWKKPIDAVSRWIIVLWLPVLIAAAYAWYNWLRFGNALEFGHNYLPEHLRSEIGQFSASYILPNLGRIMRLPSWDPATSQVVFPTISGFAFWLVNPMFLAVVTRLHLPEDRTQRWVWLALAMSLFLHAAFLLSHVTFGGFQFGTRYLADLIPWFMLWITWTAPRWRWSDWVLLILGVAVNIYGFIWLYQQFL